MGFLFTLGILGVSAFATNAVLVQRASERADLKPTIFNMDARVVGGAGGLLGALLLPGIFAPVSAGIMLGSFLSNFSMTKVKKDLDEHQLKSELQEFAPPVGPGPAQIPQQPGGGPLQRLWNWMPGLQPEAA